MLFDTDEICPLCGYDLMVDPETMKVTCDNPFCDFKGNMIIIDMFPN